jgi:hypothetical protein
MSLVPLTSSVVDFAIETDVRFPAGPAPTKSNARHLLANFSIRPPQHKRFRDCGHNHDGYSHSHFRVPTTASTQKRAHEKCYDPEPWHNFHNETPDKQESA